MDAKTTAETIRSILSMPGQKIARKRLDELAKDLEATARDDAERAKKYDELQAIGKGAAEGIAAMVAALECDYDRLEELRDERADLVSEASPWPKLSDMPKDYTCSCGLYVHAEKYSADDEHTDDCPWHALTEWDEANGEELKELTEAAGECESREQAERLIREDPLSIDLTFGSCSPGERPEVDGFTILLGTGGPAVRIVGELDERNQPQRAWIEAQNWFTAWTEYHGDGCSRNSLLTYCGCFNFESGE